MEDTPTNLEKATAAEMAMIYHQNEQKGMPCDPVPNDDVIDLLTDLRHFCAAKGLEFNELNAMAESYYHHEEEPNTPEKALVQTIANLTKYDDDPPNAEDAMESMNSLIHAARKIQDGWDNE